MSGEYAFFQSLVARTQLGATAVTNAARKHERVRRALNRHYYGIDSPSANSLLVGSYGKDTAIRPRSDVDLLFELPWSVWARYDKRAGNVQSQLLQEVRDVLLRTFSTTAIRGDGQIVSVPFTKYNIEVLPAFRATSGRYVRADANGGGCWRVTDPRDEMASLIASNAATGGKTTHLIKLAKAWKRARNVPIKSLVLELAAVQFLAEWADNTRDGVPVGYLYYDWMMRDFFEWLEDQTNDWWALAGGRDGVATGDGWAAQARFAAHAADRACDNHLDDLPSLAVEEWRNVFGVYIP